MSSPILLAVSKQTGVPVDEILSRNRKPHIMHARWIAMKAFMDRPNASLSSVGRRLDRDHSTVRHGLEKLMTLRSVNRDVAKDCEALGI